MSKYQESARTLMEAAERAAAGQSYNATSATVGQPRSPTFPEIMETAYSNRRHLEAQAVRLASLIDRLTGQGQTEVAQSSETPPPVFNAPNLDREVSITDKHLAYLTEQIDRLEKLL